LNTGVAIMQLPFMVSVLYNKVGATHERTT
jgi:hypothetical protein